MPGPWEWVIILVIVVLLFGVGRISKVGGELGRGIHEFRNGLSGNEGEEKPAETAGNTQEAKAEENKPS